MVEYCWACQRERVDNIRLWSHGDQHKDPEGPSVESHTVVHHRNFSYRKEDAEPGNEPNISDERKEQIRRWMLGLIDK